MVVHRGLGQSTLEPFLLPVLSWFSYFFLLLNHSFIFLPCFLTEGEHCLQEILSITLAHSSPLLPHHRLLYTSLHIYLSIFPPPLSPVPSLFLLLLHSCPSLNSWASWECNVRAKSGQVPAGFQTHYPQVSRDTGSVKENHKLQLSHCAGRDESK